MCARAVTVHEVVMLSSSLVEYREKRAVLHCCNNDRDNQWRIEAVFILGKVMCIMYGDVIRREE